MPSAYLQWQFHSGEQDVARGPLVVLFFSEKMRLGIYCELSAGYVDPADVGVGIGLTLFGIVMTLSLYVQFLVNQWLESCQKEIKCFRSPQ